MEVNGPIYQLKKIIPIFNWLPNYSKGFFRWDLMAGITLAAFLIPESMAYASLAGLPPEVGIYCCLAGGLFFAFFTSTKQVAVGPTSAISLMIGTSLTALAGADMQAKLFIASFTAGGVFILCLMAWALKLSSLVNFIGENVLLGFKAGAALSIASTQLPLLFGFHSSGANFFLRINNLIQEIPTTNFAVLGVGAMAWLLLILGNKFLPGRPIAMVVMVFGILVFSYTNIGSFGFELTGNILPGIPPIGMASFYLSDIEQSLSLALGCFLMGYVETIAVAKTFAEKYNMRVQPQQELLSFGVANFASSLMGGYAVSGGLSQSTVNDKAGAKTPLALIIASFFLLILLLFFTGLLKNLPIVLLAVLVLDALLNLIKIKELKRLYQLSKVEFGIAAVAFVAVLFFGILKGVLIASILSILYIINKSAHPIVTVLGKIPGTNKYSDVRRHPDNILIPKCTIIRIEASVFYFNANAIYDQVLNLVQQTSEPITQLVLDLSATSDIDVEGSKMLVNLAKELKNRNISFKIVEALADVRDILRLQGMEEITGRLSRKVSIEDAILST